MNISSAAVLGLALLGACRGERDAPVSAPPPVDAEAPLVAATVSASASAPPSATPVDADAGAVMDASAPLGMLTIPAGIFLMGSPSERGLPEERPMHEVIVAAFDLDRTEVTTHAYRACMAAGACTAPHSEQSQCNTSRDAGSERGEHPINCVDAKQADAFCAWSKKRLPTEREWEYAARGGAEERRFSWGEDDPTTTRACYFHQGTCPVASFEPGAFGLYDMSGNVWEWTSSFFGYYPDEAKTGSNRVYRGGSWSRRFPKWLTTVMRNRYEPDKWSAALGMRCARSRLPLSCPPESEPRGDACVRVTGTPRCEPSFAWNGEMCTVNGGPSPPKRAEVLTGEGTPDKTVTRSRTPGQDPDCVAHYPGKPAAYRFSGATFHARNHPLEAAGCSRRDMGQTWTSACCPR